MSLPRAIAVVGPTASGKSRLGLEIAARFDLRILCCDSVQVYRGLDIGSAKPSAAERARIPHALIDLVDPDRTFSAGDYARAAAELVGGGPALFVGGTGLYLRAATTTSSVGDEDERGGDRSREDPERRAFEDAWGERERRSPGAIHAELQTRDPETAAAIHPRNLVRALRALWLCDRHGRPVSAVRRERPQRPTVRLLMIVLDPGVAVVDEAIDRRCEAMLRAGWLEEVEMLRAAGYDARHKAMRSLGYHQLLDVVEGRASLPEATATIKSETRRYARRQRTYFGNQIAAELRLDLEVASACPWPALERFLDHAPEDDAGQEGPR
ncbi:MAG: tRNA (adenosine(37)-N6)-dimethylallyltransferase MiaA [Nannocystaceae bacterium]